MELAEPTLRERALASAPPPLQPDNLALWDAASFCWEPGEVRAELLEIDATGSGVLIRQQVWWFDEDASEWSLDDTTTLVLPAEQAILLRRRLTPGF